MIRSNISHIRLDGWVHGELDCDGLAWVHDWNGYGLWMERAFSLFVY
jgi:hypothetical protein